MGVYTFTMFWQDLVSTLLYTLAVLVVWFLGIRVYDLLHPGFNSREEMVEKDNTAFTLSQVGLFAGLLAVMGGALVGPSAGFRADLVDLFFWGGTGVVLLLVSLWINDRILLRRFSNLTEIIRDRNAGVGAVELGASLGTGLIIYGAVSGEGGGLFTALVFWLLGQVVFLLSALVYQWVTPFDFLQELENDNAAAGAAFGGLLVGVGNLLRLGLEGDFVSWSTNLVQFGAFTLVALLAMPLVRWLADWVLLPGATFTREIAGQEKPNLGAGLVEGFSYIAVSVLLGWII